MPVSRAEMVEDRTTISVVMNDNLFFYYRK